VDAQDGFMALRYTEYTEALFNGIYRGVNVQYRPCLITIHSPQTVDAFSFKDANTVKSDA
jgi:hypothetical protein